jgi:hypothetical protein
LVAGSAQDAPIPPPASETCREDVFARSRRTAAVDAGRNSHQGSGCHVVVHARSASTVCLRFSRPGSGPGFAKRTTATIRPRPLPSIGEASRLPHRSRVKSRHRSPPPEDERRSRHSRQLGSTRAMRITQLVTVVAALTASASSFGERRAMAAEAPRAPTSDDHRPIALLAPRALTTDPGSLRCECAQPEASDWHWTEPRLLGSPPRSS